VVLWVDLLSDLTSQLSKYPDVSYDRPKAKKDCFNVAKNHLIPEILLVTAVHYMKRLITLKSSLRDVFGCR